MTFVKFCGMTREGDVELACELGADAIGFVLWRGSPRAVSIERAAALAARLPPHVAAVGVLVDPAADEIDAAHGAGMQIIQRHGAYAEGSGAGDAMWIAASLDTDLSALPPAVTILLDAHDPVRHGGTGRLIDWKRAAAVASRRRVVLAGGLTAGNVRQAIEQVQPFGVDVASGIEDEPGVKNAQAMRAFLAAVRGTTS